MVTSKHVTCTALELTTRAVGTRDVLQYTGSHECCETDTAQQGGTVVDYSVVAYVVYGACFPQEDARGSHLISLQRFPTDGRLTRSVRARVWETGFCTRALSASCVVRCYCTHHSWYVVTLHYMGSVMGNNVPAVTCC